MKTNDGFFCVAGLNSPCVVSVEYCVGVVRVGSNTHTDSGGTVNEGHVRLTPSLM